MRHFVKKGIEHGFKVELEKRKQEHAKELATLKAESDRMLENIKSEHSRNTEILKAELQVWMQAKGVQSEVARRQAARLIELRSRAFPALVACLRKMKRDLEFLLMELPLYHEKQEPEEERSKRGKRIKTLFHELGTSHELFEKTLDDSRLILTRSAFALQKSIAEFLRDNERAPLSATLSDAQLAAFERAYQRDIGDLTELFYGEWTLPSAIESSEYAKSWMDWNVHRDQKSSGG